MNKRLAKVREDIIKNRERKKELDEHYRVLLRLQRQLEDEEIIATVRANTEKGMDVIETVRLIEQLKKDQEKEHVYYPTESEVILDE